MSAWRGPGARSRRAAAVAIAILIGAATGCAEATPEASVGTSTSSPPTGASATPPAAAEVDRLEVRTAEDPAVGDYRRDAFGGDWDYDPASGCNTRERVLIAESLIEPTVDDRCRTRVGRWRSIYDGVVTDDPADLQVDHVVPLADAWRSGAAGWTDERRHAFANDLAPETLAAVTGATNQSKSDATPDEWLPPDRAAWCDYAEAWVAIKLRWELSVTPAEKSTLVSVLSGCEP